MRLYKLLLENPLGFLLVAIPLLFSVIIHEVAHGWVAFKMGDPTAKHLGRLTLNPLKHLDPFGTLALFLVGFGWAKPVPVNFNNIREKRKGLILVSSAGVIANILIAIAAQLILRLFSGSSVEPSLGFLDFVSRINILLAALNLIPIPPLDGSKILAGILGGRTPYLLARLEPFGLLIIVALLFMGILDPIIHRFMEMIQALIKLLLP